MSEEYFDVVDDQDMVVDRQPRSAVHRRKLLHRAVHVFVFRSDGRMLIHKRAASKEEFPSVWTSSCSGHVSAGETYESSAPRELLEELGISSHLQRLEKFPAQAATSWEFTTLFAAHSDSDIHPDPHEMSDTRWLLPAEIESWLTHAPDDFSPAFRILFGWFRKHRTP
ncbi:MAG: NUDIX hydrolase [Planctomycetota bacterium]